MTGRAISLRVLCEGPTEQNFVTQVLRPHLMPFRVFASGVALRPGQFGSVPYEVLGQSIQAEVGRSRSHEFTTTMIDLYKIGRFPGAEKRAGETPVERAERIEAGMAQGLPNPRFIPYVQVHEFEALVLVDVDQIPLQYPDGEADHVPNALRASIGDTPPEAINDGDATAPSKRILGCLPSYQKPTVGPRITAAIGLPRLREACPHFSSWVATLETLA